MLLFVFFFTQLEVQTSLRMYEEAENQPEPHL